MQFLAASAGVFLFIIPLIVLFYLLKQKKEDLEVSSNFLWQKILADTLSQTPWQKLRRNLLLFLQLLITIILVLALMRPYLVKLEKPRQDLILLLDTSASMAVKEQGTTRLDKAKGELKKLILGQKPGTKFTLIEVGQVPKTHVNLTKDQDEAITRLNRMQTGTHQANLEPTLSLVSAILQKGSKAKVVLASDGGIQLPSEPVGLPDFQYLRIGARADNLAIGAFSLRQEPEGQLALTRIENYGSRELEANVKLLAGDKLLDIKAVKVAPDRPAHLFWQVPADVPFLEARLDNNDGLSLDNSAWIVPGSNKQVKVLLVTGGNIFIEQVLKLNPRFEVDKINPGELPGIRERYQLYVLDGFWPETNPHGQLLIINPPAESGLVAGKEGRLKNKLQPAENHPLLNYVTWGDVHIGRSKGLSSSGEWRPVLSAGDRAIITAGRLGPNRAVAFGFDLHWTDLPLRPAFPVLMQNTFDWLIPSGAVRESQITPGAAIELALNPVTEKVFLHKPDGSRVPLAPPFPLKNTADTWGTGIYKVEQVTGAEKQVDYFAVNFFSPRESQIKPVSTLKLGGRSIKAQEITRVNREFWPWLVFAVIILLSIEWWVYLRGH